MASKNDNLNISIFTALKVSEVSNVPVLLIGGPGVGKSTGVYMFADVRGYQVEMLRGNSESPESIMGYDVAPKDVTFDKPMAAIHLRPSWFERILRRSEEGEKTLLFLDEITTANEFVQAALLHLIFERKCGTESLPEDTLIVAAGNYAGNISSSMQVMSPVMNRFMIFNVEPDHTDLDTFLNKFDGAALSQEGKVNDFKGELLRSMKEIDAQEIKVDEKTYNRIGDMIERSIRDTTRMIMTTNGKLIDMKVKDLRSLYDGNNEDDTKLYGFVSMRTLNYLRDVTIAYYLCFGKAGISSANYRNSIDGLCGVGVNRDSKTRDVKINPVGADYFSTMQVTVNEIEKLKNTTLPLYEEFFNNVLKDDKGNTKITFTKEEIIAIGNKLQELKNDKELASISRPIGEVVFTSICENISTVATKLANIKTTGAKVTEIPLETVSGSVMVWNAIADTMTLANDIVFNSGFGYDKSKMPAVITKINDNLRESGFKLKSVKRIILSKNPEAESLIPAIKSIKTKND